MFHPEGWNLMQVPQEVLDCVGFVCYDARDGETKTIGTAFFLAMELPGLGDDGPYAIYAVTARHLIDRVKERSINGKVIFRLNTRAGGTAKISVDYSLWQHHPSKNSDISIIPINLDFRRFNHQAVRDAIILTDKTIKEQGVGPGDDLFFPGLFVHHQGESANIPIIRTGTIAAMPGEPIQTEKHGQIVAYLIEARSIGGLSGSPVFLHFSGPRAMKVNKGAWNTLYLMGVIQGHYGVRDIQDAAEDDYLLDNRPRSINMGIAIVTPIADVMEILALPQNVEQRRNGAARYL